ncbi:MAG: PBP1A family penicillin-binding protein [Holosporaceae bacterium]|jgi:penicillin-binding protein 1A|nr:PBP1A family penicillin-binding protein [Holosporaceae bacterium]
MKYLCRIWYAFLIILSLAAVGVSTIFFVFYFFSTDLPNHNFLKEYSPALSSRVFLRDGGKLCEYANEKRYFIPIDKVPGRLIKAFISVEDKHFFQHPGIDIIGVARSALKNIINYGTGRRPQGASTITQQVARIFLLRNNEISYIRKLKEAILSYRIENTLSKKQILERYLNQIYLGMGSYGVAAAAKTYFDKSLDELTTAECSYLATLAKGANLYHPEKHRNRAIRRRNWAIRRQFEDGYITQKEMKAAIAEDLKIVKHKDSEVPAEYFAGEIRRYLIEKYPSKSLNKNGLIIRATLDTKIQQCAQEALRKGIETIDRRYGWKGVIAEIDATTPRNMLISKLLAVDIPRGMEEFLRAIVLPTAVGKTQHVMTEGGEIGEILPADIRWAKTLKPGNVVMVTRVSGGKHDFFSLRQLPRVQGAIVVIDVHCGRILAMQGGYSFAQSEFNRAVQAMRQIGSAFKPFVYLAGLENGFAPNTIVDASPIEIDLGGNLGIWRPKNYHGAVLDRVTFRQAIEKSINTATIRIAQEVGLEKVARIAEKFGIFDVMPELLSYSIGAGETTLLKLTTAYAMFANGGKKITPTMVEYIQDKHGNVISRMDERRVDQVSYDAALPPRLNNNRPQILSEQSVYQLTSMLEGVMQRGSGASASWLNFPIAGKTGTSNDSRDTWFLGYTPDIAVGVFIGFDDYSKNLGRNANGSNTALPIFIDFMAAAMKHLQAKPFRVPNGIKLRKINSITGGPPTENSKQTIVEVFKDEDDDENREVDLSSSGRSNMVELIEERNDSSLAEPGIAGVY